MVDTVCCFMYGSLRKGGHNFGRFSRGVKDVAPGETRGAMYALIKSGGYPLANFLDDRGPIKGEIQRWYINSPEYHRMSDMEIGAGYVPIMVDVITMSGVSIPCLVWHADVGRDHPGPYIEDGDWISFINNLQRTPLQK